MAIRPPAMMITRPQTASTSDMMWVDRRIVCRLAQLFDQAANLANLDRIETGGRLVEDQDVGIMNHGLGQTDALPESSRQVAQDAVFDVRQSAPRNDLTDGQPAPANGAHP